MASTRRRTAGPKSAGPAEEAGASAARLIEEAEKTGAALVREVEGLFDELVRNARGMAGRAADASVSVADSLSRSEVPAILKGMLDEIRHAGDATVEAVKAGFDDYRRRAAQSTAVSKSAAGSKTRKVTGVRKGAANQDRAAGRTAVPAKAVRKKSVPKKSSRRKTARRGTDPGPPAE